MSPGGGITLVPDYCCFDVRDFVRTLAVARRILDGDFTGKDTGRLDLLTSQLLDLYQGHYLSTTCRNARKPSNTGGHKTDEVKGNE